MSFDVSIKLCLKIFILFSLNVYAEDITIITADRIYSNADKSTSDVTIITSEDIKKQTARTLPEILSHQSDLNVVTSGPNGSNASLFLRGTDSSHVLVVLDGIILNDPSNPNRQFDIGRLSLNNIEKIEILKGSQGLAYGSNAIGGVVVLTSKRAKTSHWSGSQYLDIGTFNTINLGLNTQKKFNNTSISLGADLMNTDGFSAADKKYNPNAEKDGSQIITLDFGASSDINENYSADLKLRYSHSKMDLDKGGGFNQDDPNYKQKEEEQYSKLELTRNWEAGNAQTKLSHSRSRHNRLAETSNSTRSTGEINTLTINHTYFLTTNLTQNINLDFQHEKDQSQHFNQNASAFLYHQYETKKSIFNFGARIDHNRIFNDHITYKLAAGYKIENNLLKLSYSTGLRAPSLNQLFDISYGNHDLTPETSNSSELSYDFNLDNGFKSTTSLFYTQIDNRLSYAPVTFININKGKAEITGAEESIFHKWSSLVNQNLSLTLLKTRDLSQNQRLIRRPNINIKNQFSFLLRDKHLLNFEITFIGNRLDVDNSGNALEMPSYLLSNFYYKYLLNSQNELYMKIKNIFNKDYEEIYGYGTGGRAITIGAIYNY